MKIIFITNGLSSGGSERVLSTLANELVTHNNDVTVMCVRGKNSFYPINPRIHLFFLDNEIHSHYLWQKMLWVRTYVKNKRPDVAISFIVRVYGFTIFSLLGCKIPVITSERNDPRHFNTLSRWIMRLSLPFSSHHVVQTESIKNYYPWFIRRKTTVIVNPVNPDIILQPYVEKKDLIISVGRLVRQKNHRMLINSFADIADKHPSYQLVIYGEGALREKLSEQVKQLGMKERIFLPGRTKDLFWHLQEARIFCMSSTHEGMSNALIEAICSGLPIITTNVSGVDDLIIHEQNGLVVPVNDEESLSKALDRLMEDKDLQISMSRENRNKISLFDLNTITNLWKNIIEETVRKHYRY